MVLKIFPGNINERYLAQAVETLKRDGVIIVPTDTVYAFACSIYSNKAFERVCRLKNVKTDKANFSFLCKDLSNISDFTKPFSNEVFRLMKNSLPGPFTFILNASSHVPAIFKSNKKTIGIRVPDNSIIHALIEQLGHPLMAASLRNDGQIMDYMTDPDEIDAMFGEQVDIIIDGGNGDIEPSTVVDCTGEQPVIIREGKGKID